MWHGILVINKEPGLTSHQVIAKLRRILTQKTIGHSGTLDPEATGVLVVGLGQATRSLFFINDTVKRYRAAIILGQATDTQDASGVVIREKADFSVNSTELVAAIRQFTGEIEQIPPMYSAVKVKGQKLYNIARQGREIVREPRTIKVFNWSILSPSAIYGYKSVIDCEITCSKGTYIRTLIHDLGQRLGCGAHMGNLIRLQSGDFKLEDSFTLRQVEGYYLAEKFAGILVPIERALSHLFPIWPTEEDLNKVLHGGKISFEKYPCELPIGSKGQILDRLSKPIAIVQLSDAGTYRYWQPVKVFQYN